MWQQVSAGQSSSSMYLRKVILTPAFLLLFPAASDFFLDLFRPID
jgi:hypothetical protein